MSSHPATVKMTVATIGDRSLVADLAGFVGFAFAFRSALTFLWFQSQPEQGSVATIGLSLCLLLIVLAWWLIDPPLHQSSCRSRAVLKWIGLYLLLSGCSLSWTTTKSVTAAGGYWLAMAADVGTVLLLIQYEPLRHQCTRLMQGFVLGATAIGIIAWCIPAMDDLRLGNEDFLHPNAVGFELALAGLMAIYLARDNKMWRWIGAGIAITLLRTLSKASIIAFMAAAAFYLLRDAHISKVAKVKIGIATTLVLASFWTILEAYADIYTQGSNAETLTGRTLIWATSWDIAVEKPYIGHGFYSFRWVVPLFGNFEAWQAHNEFLQQFFAYGIVGVIIVAGIYLAFYRQLRTVRPSGLKTLAAALLICALVRGVVDAERFDLSYPLWLLALMSGSLPQMEAGPAT